MPLTTQLDTSKILAQRRFMESTSPELLFSGAFGAGKSRIGCEKGHFLSTKYPGNRGLVARKKYTDLRDTTMDTYFRYVCPPEHIQAYNKQEHKVTLKNGSEILWYGLDQSTKVASLEVGWIFCDEIIEFTEEDYVMLLGRLRHPVPFHQIFGATNPSSPSHWCYNRFYLDTELKRTGVTEVVESGALDNPFTPESYKDRLKTLKGKYRERYVEGKWVGFEGLVYDIWEPSQHILPRDSRNQGLTGDPDNPIPLDWDRYRVVDFGFTNPFCCQWWASPKYKYTGPEGQQDQIEIPPDERVFVMYREIYYTGRPVPAHGNDIMRLSMNEKFVTTFADWDAGDRAILERAGIPTTKASKEVSSGIQSVYEAIAANRVFILEDCRQEIDYELSASSKPSQTIEEFPNYTRQRGKDGKYNPKEEPVKVNDHGMDNIRYLIYSLKVASLPSGRIIRGTTQESILRGSMTAPTSRWPIAPDRKYTSGERVSWRKV
jgi:phage terminase large subunit